MSSSAQTTTKRATHNQSDDTDVPQTPQQRPAHKRTRSVALPERPPPPHAARLLRREQIVREKRFTNSPLVSQMASDPALLAQFRELLKPSRADTSVGSTPTVQSRLWEMRRLLLTSGVPEQIDIDSIFETLPQQAASTPKCSLRGFVWKTLLGVLHVDAASYVALVQQAQTPHHLGTRMADIFADAKRTFCREQDFWSGPVLSGSEGLPDDAPDDVPWPLVRVLAALSQLSGSHSTPGISSSAAGPVVFPRGYVQGLNTLGGVLLMAMPELDAFYSLHTMLRYHCPQYFLPTLDGVHRGCALVDKCLKEIDPPLHEHLSRALGLDDAPTSTFVPDRHRGAYALPMLMSFFACCRPLHEVLRLWDAMVAYGFHLNVVICVALVVLLRKTLLDEANPLQHLTPRNLLPLDSKMLLMVSFEVLGILPESLLHEIMLHPLCPENEISQILATHKRHERESAPRQLQERLITNPSMDLFVDDDILESHFLQLDESVAVSSQILSDLGALSNEPPPREPADSSHTP